MGYTLLYSLFVISTPIAAGFLYAMLLREFYVPPEPVAEETTDPVSPSAGEEAVSADRQSLSEDDLPEQEETGDGEGLSDDFLPETADAPPAEPSAEEAFATDSPEPVAVEAETDSMDEFSDIPEKLDEEPLPASPYQVDSILNDILEEEKHDIPDDLEARIEEVGGNLEDRLGVFEEESNDPFPNEEDDILARALDSVDSEANLPEGEPGVHTLENGEAGSTGTPEPISPMAVELLGEDFDFESLVDPIEQLARKNDVTLEDGWADAPPKVPTKTKVEEAPASTPQEVMQPAPKIAEETTPDRNDSPADVLQADIGTIAASPPGPGIDNETEVFAVFPPEFIRKSVIEAETAPPDGTMSFVEETRPLFVRKKKPKTP